jgi:predicted nuclease of predicted toxin-antitoxin system
MRLLADENLPLESVRALRDAGHDVFSAAESAPGIADAMLLSRAHTEGRLIITFDRDFGELAARRGHVADGGILLLRFVPRSADDVTVILLELLARTDLLWAGRLSVLDRVHLRQRPL